MFTDFLNYILDMTNIIISVAAISIILLFIYDKWVQRKHSLLINYPVIGRMRYVFEALREPLRQYFAEESFYDSRDKIDWVYKAAADVPNYMSFSIAQPFSGSRFIIKHSSHVLNEDEVDEDTSVTFGAKRRIPYVASSPIVRSAMSDGALSPEAVRAFTLGGSISNFTLNVGEGGLTSNFFYTHKLTEEDKGYMEIVQAEGWHKTAYSIADKIFNKAVAAKVHRRLTLKGNPEANTYIFDPSSHSLFRVNWDAPLENFPKEIPSDMPSLALQFGSGLYGVRDKDGNFDEDRYAKVMKFCHMTEIKIAQGAKQTGGKLVAEKVTADIAYYRNVPEGENLISPNRFPYDHTDGQLFDFIGRLQEISGKPVGFKIVISDADAIDKIVSHIAKRKHEGQSIPDFITVDSGEGGSATAPLEMMESVGLTTNNALYLLDYVLREHQIRDDIKVIASGKILTPDDAIITLSMGADAIGIARGFMMSGGCIRARMCSGTGSHKCPVGLATQDEKKRASYLVVKQGHKIASYHKNLVKGIRGMLAIMGVKHVSQLSKKNLTFKNQNGEIYFDIDKYFQQKLHI
ncbi:MAG: FMN-binding glutamate synthase family protein [Helicobacteraceae bacterium]|nr:FMN-binding glutamate synthase family protein [Helicobacteraceae bacterium]